MIIDNSVVLAETNSKNKVACTIEANSVMFDLLSSRLYSNKPLAVVREISTNAYDSHVVAGKASMPFKVHLPTRLEPYFSVRDFGTGMTHETVMKLYSTLGSSDKRESNLLNGALGVGSKSPFAYTQGGAFTLTSIVNGYKHIYSVYSDGGVPSIAELGEFATTEENGVEVSVPVQLQDIRAFEDSAVKTYAWFDTKPDCNIVLNYFNNTVLFEGKDKSWQMLSNQEKPCVVMANVAYPLEQFESYGGNVLKTNGIVIYVKTGDVQMAGSRESLSYTPDTIKFLKEKEQEILSELMDITNTFTKNNSKAKDLCDVFNTLPKDVLFILKNSIDIKKVSEYLDFDYRTLCISSPITSSYSFEFWATQPYGRNLLKKSRHNPSEAKYTYIFADIQNKATQVLKKLKEQGVSKNVIVVFQKGVGNLTKKEIIHNFERFSEGTGIVGTYASDEYLKLFGTKVVNGSKTSSKSTSNGVFFASYLKYKKDDRNFFSSNYEIKENDFSGNRVMIPALGGYITDKSYTRVTNSQAQNLAYEISNILYSIGYSKEVEFVIVPKTYSKFMSSGIYIGDFIKNLKGVCKYKDTDAVDNELRRFPYRRVLQDVEGLPSDIIKFSQYLKSFDDLVDKHVFNIADRIKEHFEFNNLKFLKVSYDKKYDKIFEAYSPLLDVTNNWAKPNRFKMIVNGLHCLNKKRNKQGV
jgi:hypothetical protein